MQQRVVSSAPHHFWELAQGNARLYTRQPGAGCKEDHHDADAPIVSHRWCDHDRSTAHRLWTKWLDWWRDECDTDTGERAFTDRHEYPSPNGKHWPCDVACWGYNIPHHRYHLRHAEQSKHPGHLFPRSPDELHSHPAVAPGDRGLAKHQCVQAYDSYKPAQARSREESYG